MPQGSPLFTVHALIDRCARLETIALWQYRQLRRPPTKRLFKPPPYLPQIARFLLDNGLQFLGFKLSPYVLQHYRGNFRKIARWSILIFGIASKPRIHEPSLACISFGSRKLRTKGENADRIH